MSFLGIYILLKLSFGVSTRGFLDFLLGGIGDGCNSNGSSELPHREISFIIAVKITTREPIQPNLTYPHLVMDPNVNWVIGLLADPLVDSGVVRLDELPAPFLVLTSLGCPSPILFAVWNPQKTPCNCF